MGVPISRSREASIGRIEWGKKMKHVTREETTLVNIAGVLGIENLDWVRSVYRSCGRDANLTFYRLEQELRKASSATGKISEEGGDDETAAEPLIHAWSEGGTLYYSPVKRDSPAAAPREALGALKPASATVNSPPCRLEHDMLDRGAHNDNETTGRKGSGQGVPFGAPRAQGVPPRLHLDRGVARKRRAELPSGPPEASGSDDEEVRRRMRKHSIATAREEMEARETARPEGAAGPSRREPRPGRPASKVRRLRSPPSSDDEVEMEDSTDEEEEEAHERCGSSSSSSSSSRRRSRSRSGGGSSSKRSSRAVRKRAEVNGAWSKRAWEPTAEMRDKVGLVARRVELEVLRAEAAGEPSDGGALMRAAAAELGALGIDTPSFNVDTRLPAKELGAAMDVMKLLALCPYKGEDLEGASDSGEGLSAALESCGLCLRKDQAGQGGLEHCVVWRNLREICVRKAKDDGCEPVKGVELEILRRVDSIYNYGLRRGGWRIKVVMPMSEAPIKATRAQPLSALGYISDCEVVEAAHPKVLMGNQQGKFSAAERQEMASRTLLDTMRAVALLRRTAADALEAAALELYNVAARHGSFRGTVWSVEEIKAGEADAESSQARAKALARRNGLGRGVGPALDKLCKIEQEIKDLSDDATLAELGALVQKRQAAAMELEKRKKAKSEDARKSGRNGGRGAGVAPGEARVAALRAELASGLLSPEQAAEKAAELVKEEAELTKAKGKKSADSTAAGATKYTATQNLERKGKAEPTEEGKARGGATKYTATQNLERKGKAEPTEEGKARGGIAQHGDGSAAGGGKKRTCEVRCPRCKNKQVVTGTEYWTGSYTKADGVTAQMLQIGGVRMDCFPACYPGAKEAKYTPTTTVKRRIRREDGELVVIADEE